MEFLVGHTPEYRRAYYKKNREKELANRKPYAEANKEKRRLYCSQYNKEHQAAKAAREAFRRAQKLKATPSWLTQEHKDQIKALYVERDKLCALSGIMYHVDHIVPLLGKEVSGLHVPWNLQLLPWNKNLAKSNKV